MSHAPIIEPDPPRRFGLLLAWLRLMRLPNVFTALADVTMGFLVVHQSLEPLGAWLLLAAASGMLYTAGMVLNDVFDIEIDRRERPERPLPSGKIPLGMARVFGFLLLTIGVAFAWLAGLAFPQAAALPWRSGAVATVLAALIVLYNALLKRTPLGPLGMGACRFANVFLGMSLAPLALGNWLLGYYSAELLIAGGIGLYIVGVTWFARHEAEESPVWQLIAGMIIMSVGVVLIGASSEFLPPPLYQKPMFFWTLLGLLMLTVLRRCGAAVLDPSPQRVQMAVKHSILSLIWLDAAIASATAPLTYAFLIAALLVPALLLGRWVYST